MLREIHMDVSELLIFNQIDKLEPGVGEAVARRWNGVAVSALERTGLRRLLTRAEQMLWAEDDGRLERQGGVLGSEEA